MRDVSTGEILVDLDVPNMKFIVAKGGRGGRGNARFASSVNRAPRICESGFPGEERDIELELKTIADVGLVGFPNAGKSTLIRAVSQARPKVAPYPFTTRHPVVGVIEFPDFVRITIADIPGLIDGAHDNVGLGHEFLRHIERTHLLVYVIDVPGADGRNPWDDFTSLERELELYMKGLSKRAGLVIANKMDLPGADENLELLKAALPPELPVIALSAATDEDFSQLTDFLRKNIAASRGGEEKLVFRYEQ